MSKRVFGEPVTSLDVERLDPDSGATIFVRLCAALIAKALGEHVGGGVVPNVSEPIHARDGGVDAELVVPGTQPVHETGGLVGPGTTIYQFKFRDVGRQQASAILAGIVRKLKPEFPRVAAPCDRYVLMTNVRLSTAQRRRLETALVDTFPAFSGRPLVVWGASEIATALNANSSVRHMFFADGAMGTVELAHDDLKRAYARIGWTHFADREAETGAIAEFLETPSTPLLQLVGPRYSGRTRLVLEALQASGRFVVWADRADVLSLAHFRDLDEPESRTVLVVDRCDGDEGRRVLEWARSRRWLKTITISVGEGWGGSDDLLGGPILRVRGLKGEATRQLVAELAPGASFPQQSGVHEAAEGLPGVAVHLAAALRRMRAPLRAATRNTEVWAQLGHQLEEEFLSGISLDERRALRVISLMPFVGVQGPRQMEIEALCEALAVRIDDVTAALPSLARRGLVRRRGRFVEVIPPFLADHLVGQALSNPKADLPAIALKLRPHLRRILEQLRQIQSTDVSQGIEAILRSAEWFGDLEALSRNADVFEALLPTLSTVAVEVAGRLVDASTSEQLHGVLAGEQRRTVVRALERATLRSTAFERATELLLALAEAENEPWDNNATGVFVSRFHWRHPEISAPYSSRLNVLSSAAASDAVERRRLAAVACGEAVRDGGRFRLASSFDLDVPESPVRPTWPEAASYARGVLDVISRLSTDRALVVAKAARQSLLRASETFVRFSAQIESQLDLGERTLSLLAGLGRGAESAAERAEISEKLDRFERVVFRTVAPSGEYPAHVVTLLNLLRETRAELSTTETLRDRLWKWVGPGSWRAGRSQDQADEALQQLARGFVAAPSELREYISWLTGSEAKGAVGLMGRLGAIDRGGTAYEVLRSSTEGTWWPTAIAQYFYGWREVEDRAADALDWLIGSREIPVIRLVDATGALARRDGSECTSRRVRHLLEVVAENRIAVVARLSWSLPWGDLDDEHVGIIVHGVDDGTLAVRQVLVSAISARLSAVGHLSPALRTVAWSLLHHTSGMWEGLLKHDWDWLAATLGEQQPERLLALLNELLRKPELETSSPHHELPQVWEVLNDRHRTQLFELLLGRAVDSDAPAWVDATLEALIDPGQDRALIMSVVERLGKPGARAVALALDAGADGFWELAGDLILRFGDDSVLLERLTGAVLSGSWSAGAMDLVEARRAGVERLLEDPDPRVRSWAVRLERDLKEWRVRAERDQEEDWLWDARVRRVEMERLVHSAETPERLWAIGRLLEDAPERRVRELLTPTEILAALPRLPQLDETTRTKWEHWARHHAASSS